MRLLLRLRWKPAAARTSVPRGVLFCLVSSCLHKTRLRKAWSYQTAACSTVEGVGTCTKQKVLPVPRPNSEGEAGLIPYRRSLCPPGWQKSPQPSQPQLKVQRGGAGRGVSIPPVMLFFYMLATLTLSELVRLWGNTQAAVSWQAPTWRCCVRPVDTKDRVEFRQ